ncbi:hypothetical protein ACFODT_15865 [Vibrio zhugei]|uniref:Uncharacterized protein n=1 Tax=Vibrio zhugei TaxID=2479546 RepID=A0ABV7CEP7_9VIBR|nr:hypothetical protein [Vibrio zhugei]
MNQDKEMGGWLVDLSARMAPEMWYFREVEGLIGRGLGLQNTPRELPCWWRLT